MTARRLLRSAVPAATAGAEDMPGPPAVEVTARHVRVGDDYAATLAVTGYPAEVSAGWLEPLLTYPGRLDVTLHIDPIPAAVAAARLRRQRARLESGRRAGASRGQLDDPGVEAAAGDARELAYRLARGEGHLFRLGLYLTVHAATEDDLAAEVAAVRALAASLLLVTVPATFRSLQGWTTTLPAGTDTLALRRTMDTAALAASFPFTSPDLPRDPAAPSALPGVLYGANTAGPGLVAWDRWAADNHNSVTLAASGAGKSYLAKLEILRSLYQGTECWVIDPEDEYARLAGAVGGSYIHLGAPDVHLNPFDLPAAGRARPDTLTRRALFLHTVIAVLLGGQPSPAERAALDKAIMAAYHQAGITADPRTWARPAPLLPALAATLRAASTEAATAVADRLVPFTDGTHAALFAAPTTTRPEGHLVVFSLRDVPDELRPAATLLRPPWARLWHGQPHLGWEYAWAGGTSAGLVIRLWVPGTIPPGLIERAVEAAWPGAHTFTAPASVPLPPGALIAGGTLRLARPEILPLSTDHDPDAPLRALAGAAAGLGDGEHAIIQVLTRPVTGARLRKARRAARRQRAAQPAGLASRLLDAASPGGHPSGARRRASRSDPELAAEIRATTGKLASPQWETLTRYGVATTTAPAGAGRWQARAATAQHMARLRGLAHALASATALYTGRNWLARRHLRRPAAAIASRRLRRGDLLSVAELAAIARLPADPALPGLARAVPPPPAIPVPGPHTRPLGVSDAGQPRPVGLAVPDARHHQRICGPTGTGKTTLIAGQILADAEAGRGVVFIDPKGDAVTGLLGRLPENVAGKVVLFDPGDARHPPPCLNVLQGDGTGTDTDMIVDNVTGIFRRIFAANWGPRTDDIFRAACLTLLGSVPPGSGLVTLADIPTLLGDDTYRRRLTTGIRDQVLRDFWDWYEQLTPPTRAHSIGPLMNKLRAFLLRKFARQAIAAGPSTFDMADVLDSGGLCLARLPKGILGEETAQLVGSFIVARTWQAAARRARLPEHARPDAGLYLDEAQNFLNLPYPLEDILAEARAYRLSVTMAHQNLAQLPADLRQGISANARSQVIFSVSPEDARDLERHTAPVLTAHDLSHLGAYQAAARLVAGSAETPAFTFRTQPLPPAIPGRARLIRAAARTAHGGASGTAPPPAAAGTDPRARPGT